MPKREVKSGLRSALAPQKTERGWLGGALEAGIGLSPAQREKAVRMDCFSKRLPSKERKGWAVTSRKHGCREDLDTEGNDKNMYKLGRNCSLREAIAGIDKREISGDLRKCRGSDCETGAGGPFSTETASRKGVFARPRFLVGGV